MLDNLYLALAKHKFSTKETRGHVGIKAGIAESRLSAIVHERKQATPGERAALAQVLGLDEEYLFAREQKQQTAARG